MVGTGRDGQETTRLISMRSRAFWRRRIWIAERVARICPSCPGWAPKVPAKPKSESERTQKEGENSWARKEWNERVRMD